jgi:hypothetical protein
MDITKYFCPTHPSELVFDNDALGLSERARNFNGLAHCKVDGQIFFYLADCQNQGIYGFDIYLVEADGKSAVFETISVKADSQIDAEKLGYEYA